MMMCMKMELQSYFIAVVPVLLLLNISGVDYECMTRTRFS